MKNHQLSKRPRPHRNDDGRPTKRPRWKHQGPRPNYHYDQPFDDSARHEASHSRRWINPRRGSFRSHQTPSPRSFYQAPHQQQFFPGHNDHSQFRGPPPRYGNHQQQSYDSFPPADPRRRTHRPSASREAEYNPSDSSASSSPSYTSSAKTDAFPGYFTTAIPRSNSSSANSSASGSTEYEPVFYTELTGKSRSVWSQSVVPIKTDVAHSGKNKVAGVLGILDPKLIQILRYLTSFQRDIQESCEGKARDEMRAEVRVPNEDKRRGNGKNKSFWKLNMNDLKSDRSECIRLLYQNQICISCEGIQEENDSEWYPRMDNWINGRAICDEITED